MFAWILWFALLLATPYHAADPYGGGLYSGMYAYVAAGSIVGAWMPLGLAALRRPLFAQRIAKCAAGMGLFISFLVFAIEWGGLPPYLAGNLETIPALPFEWVLRNEQIFVLTASLSCSFVGVHIMCYADRMDGGIVDACRAGEYYARFRMFGRVAPCSLFLFGFVRVAAWSLFVPYVTHSAFANRVFMSTPFAFVIVPLIAALLLGWAIVHGTRLVDVVRGDKDDGRGMYAAILITALDLGMVCWNMLTRVAPVARIDVLGQPVVILVVQAMTIILGSWFVWVAFAWRRFLRQEELECKTSKGQEAAFGEERLEVASAFFAESNLTSRERDAVGLMLLGLTSSESADRMGIRPSTVRAYLQRAYRKLDVANAEELAKAVRAYGADSGRIEAAKQSAVKQSTETVQFLRALQVLVAFGGLLGVVVSLFVPHAIDFSAWGMGRELLVGGGSALVVVGSSAMFFHWSVHYGLSVDCPIAQKKRFLSVFLCLAMLVSGVVVVRYVAQISSGGYLGGYPTSLVFACASFVFVSTWSAGAMRGLVSMRSLPMPLHPVALPIVLVAVTFFILSSISRETWLVSALVALLASASVYALPSDGEEALVDCARSYDHPLSVTGTCVYLALGFSAEELWRSLSAFSLADSIAPFLVAAVVGGAVLSWRVASPIRGASLVSVLVLFAGILAGRWRSALFFSAMLQVLLITSFSLRRNALEARFLSTWVVAAGCGCLAGLVGVDACSDFLLAGSVLLEPFGGQAVLSERMFIASGMLFMFLGTVAVLFFRRLRDEVQLERIAIDWGGGADDRIRHFFLGRGLNETRSLVLVEVVHGATSSAISNRLNYARGTVNSARDSGYRALGVHSRAQLIVLLQENVGL